jgi:hypothetical protein
MQSLCRASEIMERLCLRMRMNKIPTPWHRGGGAGSEGLARSGRRLGARRLVGTDPDASSALLRVLA